MRDLTSKRLIVTKGLLFLALALASAALILVKLPTLEAVVLLAILVWAACRFYYFLFYVLQTYVDPNLRYAGLTALLGTLWRARARRDG